MADKRFVAKNGLDNNSQTIVNVANPTANQDAATKTYVDGLTTDTAITGKLLTNYAVGSNTALAAADTILQAFQKVQGQINARISGNQTITLSGDASGSGTTAIAVTLANSGVGAGTYRSVTVNAKGLVTGGTNPTTLAGYGITDALSNSTTSTQSGYFGDIFLYDDSTPSHYLGITNSANLTAARTLSLNVNDADRTISLSGNLTVSAAATVSGTNTGDQTTISGNAGTATTLQTARSLWGNSFNGSANVTGALWLQDSGVNQGRVGATSWHDATYINTNLYYAGTGDVYSAANWRYIRAGGVNNIAGGLLILKGNGAEAGTQMSYYTAPTSTAADAAPASLNLRWRIDGAGAMTVGASLDVGSVGAITAATMRVGGDIRASGTIYANDFVLTGGAGSGTGLTLDSLDDVITTSPYAPTDQQVLTFDVAAGNKWIPKTVSGGGGTTVTISDDTTTNGNRYVSFVAATSGTASTLNVASTKLTFNPSTGTLNATAFGGSGASLTSLNASNVSSGTLALARGGTGATTQAGAANAILPSQTSQSGKYLTTDGTNVSWATVTTGSSVTVSDDTTTNATRYLLLEDVTSGTVSTVNVSSTKLTFNPSTGVLTASGGFSGLTSGQVTTALGYTPLSPSSTSSSLTTFGSVMHSGRWHKVYDYALNATPTNGVQITTTIPFTSGIGMYTIICEGYRYGGAVPEGWMVSFYPYNGGSGTQLVNHGASSWGAAVPTLKLGVVGGVVCLFLEELVYFRRFTLRMVYGAQSETASHAEGWTASDNTAATAGATNVITPTFTNAFGNVNASNLTVTNTISGSVSGTAANVTGTVAIANGGTGSTTQAGARTGLGATTVGANLFTLGNPGAITFLRINADNTVSALDAATFRTAIGAGTGSGNGTVTSVSGTGTVSGLTLSGTVTTTGNLTLSGTLSVTPSNFASQTANTVLAAPNGSAGVPTFRTLVLADLPSSILRSVGHPNYGNWDTFGNEEQTVREIYQEHFNTGTNTGSSNFPSNASYKYGTLVNFGAGASARAQVYISHTGNDLVFRGGWTTNSWQTWNRVLTDQNYTTYSPSLTGTGATGTNWAISITGNAATVTNGVYLSGAQDISGNKRFRNTPGFAANSSSFEDGLSVYQATGGSDAMLTFHIAGDWAGHFGLGGAENDLVWTGWSVGNTRHRILHSGNYNLFTAQGSGINYASSSAWTTTNGAQTGYFGGNFNLNGDGSENQNLYRGDTMPTPFASPGLVWVAQNNDTSSNADGGWDKAITGLDPNKTYRSIVWFRRNSSSTNGTWYHGCADCLYPNGNAVGNPYFISQGIGAFTQGRWYLSVGYIHANNDGIATSNYGGIYDSVTGAKVFSNNDFRMGSGQTTQTHRTYMYYSTDPAAVVEWWAPRFEEVNGNEPSINSLLMGSPEQKVVVTSTNVGSHALPIVGGTMSGAITFAAGQTWPTFNQSTTGNAATATTLQTARNINGTSFNGSANITTASWGTARTITIGSTGKSVDGSANVSWTLGEIGALGASAKAADSELLDGLDSSVFLYGANGSGVRTAAATQNVYELAQYKAGFWDANGAGWTPDGGWWWGATFAHVSNSGSYNYSGQLAFQNGGGGDNLYARTINNGGAGSWSRLLSSGNYSSYALPLSGGTLTGALSGTSASFSGNVTAADFVLSSDTRLKIDLVPLTAALSLLDKLTAYRYTHIKNRRQEVGVLAQEVREVLPEAVTEGEDGMLGVSYDRLVPLLLVAVKELTERVKTLEHRA